MTEQRLAEPKLKYEYDVSRCPKCGWFIKDNWLVRHGKSGCTRGVYHGWITLSREPGLLKWSPESKDTDND